MSRENVEIVEAALLAFGRHGADSIPEYWAEDIDHRAVEGAIDDRCPIHGRERLLAYMQDWTELFDDFKVEPAELIDAGGDRVIALLEASGKAKLSGVETQVNYAIVYTLRGEKIVRGREYRNGEEALQAAGLSE